MFQELLEVFGQVLSFLYDTVAFHNYGVAIILLTLLIRIALLPLTIKQTRSMAEMQQIQPLIKELQKKYKGDRQKLNEELMKVYKEHKVNPLGGCLPLLMQLPFFFALYAVTRGDPNKVKLGPFRAAYNGAVNPAVAHLPIGSALALAINADTARFLGMNLSCTPSTAGRNTAAGTVEIVKGFGADCGSSWVAAIPFFVLVAGMVATTWYQQRQMQKMSGQVNPQMQMMGRIMPVFLGFISLSIPAGVLLYWVTTNLWQIGQQRVMMAKRMAAGTTGPAASKSSAVKAKGDGSGSGKGSGKAVTPPPRQERPPAKRGGSGRSGGGSRKKRRKR
jgi:YidC/Oxa1 family membrane protein insertase